MADGIPEDFSKDELLRRVESRWTKLQDLLGALAAEDWERPLGDGWPVKVHLAHLADWENSLLGILGGASRSEAMGVPDEIWDRHNTDEINGYLAQKAMGVAPEDARQLLERSHRAVVERLSAMAEADLLLPYSHYQPNDPPHNPRPVLAWIAGNTFGHYDEHIEWLEQGLIA